MLNETLPVNEEILKAAFLSAKSSPEQAKRATSFVARFQSLATAEDQQAFTNLFEFLENAIFGTLKNRLNQKILLLAIKALKVIPENGRFYGLNKAIDLLEYLELIESVIGMTSGAAAQQVRKAGLNVAHVAWEDTARNQNSSYGRNISDLTVRLDYNGKDYYLPVIRTANYTDQTADINPEEFLVNVGNAKGEPTKKVSLRYLLENPWEFLTDSAKWPKDSEGNPVKLFAAGVDSQVLVSSQMCLVPIPKKSVADGAVYRPHIYNYQSFYHPTEGPQPYVLTLLVTREGVSIDVLGKEPNARGQTLSINKNGQRAPLTAKTPDEVEKQEMAIHKAMGLNAQDNADQHDRVLIIQIPLIPKWKDRPGVSYGYSGMTLGEVSGTLTGSIYKSGQAVSLSTNTVACSDGTTTDCHETESTVNLGFIGHVGHGKTTLSHAIAQGSSGAGPFMAYDSLDKALEERERWITVSTSSLKSSHRRTRAATQDYAERELDMERAAPVAAFERAVIGSGPTEGPYSEELGSGWTRDATAPIRITVQLVKALGQAGLSEEQVKIIHQELLEVNLNATRIGSLVVNS